ncbi:fl(2)d-associated complex component-like isoform X1 [Topomyia yanbarensis]|uniref:fl(2)d-associated complex component-like isoform X1 n=1 Tax=Topomyia yanbarensis TaxID=2498891 RepID=UPI00273AF5A1|nr:fl(2)d-associated complex component-like isoform X1 [Topomyia yanbarensis]
MSTPVKRKITLELNPNKKVLPKDRPSVFQRLGTKKFPLPVSSTGGIVPGKQHQEQESGINKEEIVKRIVGCDEPEPVPAPKIVPESVSAHARLIEAQLAAKLGKVIVSRGETIGGVAPVPPPGPVSSKHETERGGHSTSTASDRGGGGGGVGNNNSAPSASAGGGGWDQSTLENADQDILERKRKELQHELKLEMDASGGGSSHHHHHRHMSSSTMKQKSAKETLVVKKIRKVPAPRRSSSSSDSSSSSGSDSSDSDSSSSSSSSSRDSRRVKKRVIRQRRDSSSSSDGGKKVIKKHTKKVAPDGTKRILTKKVGTHLTTKIRVKKVTSPGGTSHLRKVAREVSPSGKTPTKYLVKKSVAVKKDKHAVVDARERVREKERELALREKEREREKERLRLREREREREHVKSRSPRTLIRSRSPRSRISPAAVSSSSRGREMAKKSPEPLRYREPPATIVRRPERSPERIDDRRRHESLKDRERRERQERELARNKEREEALARCQERQRERERLAAAAKEKARRPVEKDVGLSKSDGGLEKPDRHRPVERLLPRPAERARALAAARSPGKIDHDRSRTPNSPRSRDRIVPRERSYDRGTVERGGYIDHHDRRSRSREREYVTPIVRGARSRDSPFERHVPPPIPAREVREYREPEPRVFVEKDRRVHDYARTDYPDDPPPRREHEREWERDREREPDRGPPQRSFDRRGDDHGRDWDRDHSQPSHSHSQEPYQGTSRSWDDAHWKESDGWAKEKERGEWKYQQERQWEHEDHPAVGPPPHAHNHGGGARRWQQSHPEQNQGSTWHAKPKEEMDYVPRHKLAGRLGEPPGGGNDRGMFRRHHPGHQPIFNPGRKSHIGMGPSRFGGNQGKYSINRTIGGQHQHQPTGSENLHQHSGPHTQQPPLGNESRESPAIIGQTAPRSEVGKFISKTSESPFGQPAPSSNKLTDSVAPAAAVAEWDDELDVVPAPVVPAVAADGVASTTAVVGTGAASVAAEGVTMVAPVVEKVPETAVPDLPALDEDNLSEISDDLDDILTREEDDELNDSTPHTVPIGPSDTTASAAPSSTATAALNTSSSMMIPSQVLQHNPHPNQFQQQPSRPIPRRPFLSKARYKSYDGCIGGPGTGHPPDLYANVDDGDKASFPIDVTSQPNESANDDKRPSTEHDPLLSQGTSSEKPLAGESQQHTSATNRPEGSGCSAVSDQDLKDAKEAGKLHANKELKEEMDLDFEEISDGELEEENKVKGLGDALGVDWASLAHETRAKLKPEQTIPVSARNRWKAHHILLDIGISVRLAGEAYAQRVLTESKEKLREEIEEFKAAAAAVEQQKVAAVKKEQEEQLFNGIKIKKEVLDEDEQEAQKELERKQSTIKSEEPAKASETSEQEANLAGIDKILHPVASVHVAMRDRAQARRNLILRSSGPHSRALSARRDLEIRRQLCGFPPQECNERITEHQSVPTNPELHETVMKLFQSTMQPKKIEVQ